MKALIVQGFFLLYRFQVTGVVFSFFERRHQHRFALLPIAHCLLTTANWYYTCVGECKIVGQWYRAGIKLFNGEYNWRLAPSNQIYFLPFLINLLLLPKRKCYAWKYQ
jgi:hypothetical protein